MELSVHLNKLRSYIEKEDFKGYDPYDALNSPLLQFLSFHQKYFRIVFIQLFKRLPLNLRPFLLVKKDYNPKGLGLFLGGYAKLFAKEKDPLYLDRIDLLLDLLEGMKSRDCSGNGWGYNFDWQSRAFFIPKFTPTVVNSSFIGHALLDTWEITGKKRALDMALPIGDFILQDLNRQEDDGTICFSYTPIDDYFVHNANLLGASLLIRIYEMERDLEKGTGDLPKYVAQDRNAQIGENLLDSRLHGNDKLDGQYGQGAGNIIGKEECKRVALAALAYSMIHQRTDGSWFYAESKKAHWIDSFHTGFNLQAIKVFLDLGYSEGWRPHFERGVDFYASRFFLEDGTPKYYHDRVYPIDIHAPAQAVVFFSQMGPAYAELTRRTLEWMITHLQDPQGYFYFQKHPLYTNSIPYMRWGQAWAFQALTEYLSSNETSEVGGSVA